MKSHPNCSLNISQTKMREQVRINRFSLYIFVLIAIGMIFQTQIVQANNPLQGIKNQLQERGYDGSRIINRLKENCGDGKIQFPEQCDDGNKNPNDSCRRCQSVELEITCGDGIVQPPEQCDSGPKNTALCVDCMETGIEPYCGDGVTTAPEQCDDGNKKSGDGCYQCNKEKKSKCGDKIVTAPETCDDGNANAKDGRHKCQLTNKPAPYCGDGIVQTPEECDDGNAVANDGCNNCQICVLSIETSCDDSDGGAVASVAGTTNGITVTGLEFSQTDFCLSTSNSILEYTCNEDGNYYEGQFIDCAEDEICENGTCVPCDVCE